MEAIRGLSRFSLFGFGVANVIAVFFWWNQVVNDPLHFFSKQGLFIWPVAAVVGELCFAIYRQKQPKILAPIRLADTRPTQAMNLVDDYLRHFEETKFGFPTGFFVPVDATEKHVRVYKEQTLPTAGIRLAVLVCVDYVLFAVSYVLEGIVRWESRDDGMKNLLQFITVTLGICASAGITIVFFFPIWIGVLGESVMKKFLASSITAKVYEAPDRRNDSLAKIELRGMSAMMAEKAIIKAFEVPMRPMLAGA
jgi:hypothetical protein